MYTKISVSFENVIGILLGDSKKEIIKKIRISLNQKKREVQPEQFSTPLHSDHDR
jgi:hypothetical protein